MTLMEATVCASQMSLAEAVTNVRQERGDSDQMVVHVGFFITFQTSSYSMRCLPSKICYTVVCFRSCKSTKEMFTFRLQEVFRNCTFFRNVNFKRLSFCVSILYILQLMYICILIYVIRTCYVHNFRMQLQPDWSEEQFL